MIEERTCVDCNRSLPTTEFYRRADTGAYRKQCKRCWCDRASARVRANPKHHARVVKARYDTFGRFARYGITAEQYASMLANQGWKCALCEADEPGGKGVWHIDHRRGPDEPKRRVSFKAPAGCVVRGLLCHTCNIALGHYQGLVDRVGLDRVAEYLARAP